MSSEGSCLSLDKMRDLSLAVRLDNFEPFDASVFSDSG